MRPCATRGTSPEAGLAELEVSGGFYVRTFVSDLGEALGSQATVLVLERTAQSGFTLDKSVPLDTLTTTSLLALLRASGNPTHTGGRR